MRALLGIMKPPFTLLCRTGNLRPAHQDGSPRFQEKRVNQCLEGGSDGHIHARHGRDE